MCWKKKAIKNKNKKLPKKATPKFAKKNNFEAFFRKTDLNYHFTTFGDINISFFYE